MSDSSPEEYLQAPESYEVGYGKPPSHSRFPKGRSGNPAGRPARSKNMTTLLAKALDEVITVIENGRRRKVSKREAIAAQLVNRSAGADLKAIGMVLSILEGAEVSTATQAAEPIGSSDADERVMQGLRNRLGKAGLAV